MGSKYAKLFCAVVGIFILSIFQFQELNAYYTSNLPYESVKKSDLSDGNQGPIEIELDKLVSSKAAILDGRKYREDELEVLADYENELLRDKILEEMQSMDTMLSDADQIATRIPTDEVGIRLSAVASVLMDGDTNRVLFGKHETTELAMASTTKIMTCIVALENGNLDDIVTVSRYAQSMPDVQLNIVAGEQYYLRDLLYSLMLESHNDTAVAIAEHIGGSVEGFASMMNEKAKALGCNHTNFVTPNGLDAEGHYTTAEELGKIACYAIQNPTFIEITNTPTHEFQEITKEKRQLVTNKNRFLYMMEGAIGVKTGFTNNAGYCFVGAVKREDRTFVSVVLGSGWPPHKTNKWNDTLSLMNYGLNNYNKKLLINQEVELPGLYVKDGQLSQIPVFAKGELSTLVRPDEVVKAFYETQAMLQAPIVAGEQVGNLKIYIDDELFAWLPVYTKEEVKKIDFNFCFSKLLDGFCWMKH